MTTTYMFDKSNRRNIMSMQRQALSIIQSFFLVSTLEKELFLSSGRKSPSSSTYPLVKEANQNNSVYGKDVTLLGKPLFTVIGNKVRIQLFYYSNSAMSNGKLSLLGTALTHCVVLNTSNKTASNTKFNVEVQAIRLNNSILDSSIFAQYLTCNAGKYSFNRIMDMLKNSLPTVNSEGSLDNTLNSTSHITGIKVRLSGRLTTQTSGPRQTVQAGRIGSSSRGPYALTEYSQHTSKNKLGAFTMKVWISQQSR